MPEFNDFFPDSIYGVDHVNVKSFGAIGNGNANTMTDLGFANIAAAKAGTGGNGIAYPLAANMSDTADWCGIQAACNWAIDNNRHRVVCPSGLYILSDTVHTSYGVVAGVANYHSIELAGTAAASISGSHANGTKFRSLFKNRPIVSMQGMLDGGVRGIAFEGPTPRSDVSAQPLAVRADAVNYVPTGAQDNQWTPFCAVCIDPYYTAPPGGFPEYPPPAAYPALCGTVPSTYGGKAHSTQMFVEECSFAYLTVAIFIYGLQQAEFGRFRQNNIGYCKIAYALGNSQARNMDFSNNLIHFCHTCFDGSSYTQQTANLQGCYDNLTTGYGYQIFQHVSAGWSGQITVNNMLNENGVILGTFSGGIVVWNECNFALPDARFNGTTGALEELWMVPVWRTDTAGISVFRNCNFFYRYNYHFECDQITLENCTFQPISVANKFEKLEAIAPGMRHALSLFGGVTVTQSTMSRRGTSPITGAFGATTHTEATLNEATLIRGMMDSNYGKSIWSIGANSNYYRVIYDIPTIARCGGAGFSIGALTGGNTRVFTPDGFTANRSQVGDVIYMEGNGWWYVSAIAGSPGYELTCKALTHTTWNGTTWAVTADNDGTGNCHYFPGGILDPWPNRNDETANGLFMKTVAGTNVVSFVDADDVAVNRPAEIDAKSALFFMATTKFVANGMPFPGYTWIDSIAAQSVTMSQDAKVSGVWAYAPGIKRLK
jgi:hypothetical protein